LGGISMLSIHIRKYFVPNGEWTLQPTKRGVTVSLYEWKELKKTITLFEDRGSELRTMDNKVTGSSSVSQSLSFNLLQSLYCPLSSVLTLCLQIKLWFFLLLHHHDSIEIPPKTKHVKTKTKRNTL
jgi:hypothetical protein